MSEEEEEPSPPCFPIPSSSLEIRLFYVRLSPSPSPPSALSLALLPREPGAPLDLDGARLPPSAAAALPLPRHPPDLTFVSTRPLRLAGALEFELRRDDHGGGGDDGDLLLCGSLDRVDPPWGSGAWALHCHAAAACVGEVEVYVAGCCGGGPVMLTQTVAVAGRRKAARPGGLDAIPEDEVSGDGREKGVICRRPAQLQLDAEGEKDEYIAKLNAGSGFYPEGAYYDEDGQLSWFNAGVRVGVGIGLGMCIGVGIGVGILMRSYQATRNTFRRRFF